MKTTTPSPTHYPWGVCVGFDWPCIVRVFNPATNPDDSPVRWGEIAPGVDLTHASWEPVSGRPWQEDHSEPSWPFEPGEGADSHHSRVPLMEILLKQATGTVRQAGDRW